MLSPSSTSVGAQITADLVTDRWLDVEQGRLGGWTILGVETTHPNGSSRHLDEERRTVRRWTSDRERAVAVIGCLRKINPNGEGATGRVVYSGDDVHRAAAENGDGIHARRQAK